MRRPLTLITALAILLTTGAGCPLLPSTSGGTAPAPVTLEYWRLDDAPAALDEVIASYRKTRPHVTIHVTKIPSADYQRVLLEALAEQRGPDLFNVRNVDLPAWLSRLAPMPKETAVPVQAMGADKKIAWTVKRTPSMSQLEIRNSFVKNVPRDIVKTVDDPEKKGSTLTNVYGLPFSADTLALLYNKDLFTKASVQGAPQSWGDFQQVAIRLTTRDKDGKLVQSGSSLGGNANERYAADLLAELIGQNGADVTTEDGAHFNEATSRSVSVQETPAVDALAFYQSFAAENAATSTWNEQMPDSLDAFVQGRLAMIFGLPSDLQAIRERAPKLDVGVAAVPQISDTYKYNVALYPIEVVSRASKKSETAWDFLQFAARAENVAPYLAATHRPAAQRSLIDGQTSDADVGFFAQQALTAVTWYLGDDYAAAQKVLRSLIAFRPTIEEPDAFRAISQSVQTMNASFRRQP